MATSPNGPLLADVNDDDAAAIDEAGDLDGPRHRCGRAALHAATPTDPMRGPFTPSVALAALVASVVIGCTPCPACPPLASTAEVERDVCGLPCIASISGTTDGALALSQFVAIAGQRDEVDVSMGEVRCTFAATREFDASGAIEITCDGPTGTTHGAAPIGQAQVTVPAGEAAATLRCARDARIDVRTISTGR